MDSLSCPLSNIARLKSSYELQCRTPYTMPCKMYIEGSPTGNCFVKYVGKALKSSGRFGIAPKLWWELVLPLPRLECGFNCVFLISSFFLDPFLLFLTFLLLCCWYLVDLELIEG